MATVPRASAPPSSSSSSTPSSVTPAPASTSWPLWPWLVAGGSLVAFAALYTRSVYQANARRAKLLSDVCSYFEPKPNLLFELFDDFKSEMRAGLERDGKALKMIPTFVNRVPTGNEMGEYYALDLGGTNFRVLKVKLGEGQLKLEAVSKYTIPEELMRGTGEALFDFIAESLDDFLRNKDPAPPASDVEKVLGFTFSFPVNQTALAAGTLIRWTKGFDATGVQGEDVVQLLQAAAGRKGLKIRVAVLANDTVGTWATTAVTDARCMAGVILGTGSNAAYVEKLGNVKKWSGAPAAADSPMAINMEWGNYASDRPHVLPTSKYDEQLDLASINPGQQRFEKMLSGMYLGELARLALVDLLNRRVLCASHRDAPWKGTFTQEHCLHTSDLSAIEADATAELSATRAVLERLKVSGTTLDDRRVVKRVSHLVVRRAALLAGTAVAAIASHTGVLSQGCTVAIDGSVYEHYPGFKAMMEEALSLILGEFSAQVKLVLSKDGSGLGAAVLAALAK